MATKLEKCHRKVQDSFFTHLHTTFFTKFGIEIESQFDIFGSMQYVTRRVDGENFTFSQREFIAVYSEAYAAAMEQICE